MLSPATDQTGSQVNFYYGAHTPYAESIAPSHHSTYAHYYDDEEDGWEMPNFYNETYMKEGKRYNQLSRLSILSNNFFNRFTRWPRRRWWRRRKIEFTSSLKCISVWYKR